MKNSIVEVSTKLSVLRGRGASFPQYILMKSPILSFEGIVERVQIYLII
jgi:hypothetical protein